MMFKKFTHQVEPQASPRFTSELVATLHSELVEPQTTIAQGVSIKGTLRFEKLLRIVPRHLLDWEQLQLLVRDVQNGVPENALA